MSKLIVAALAAWIVLTAIAVAAPAVDTASNSAIAAPSSTQFASYAIGHDRAMVALGRLAQHRGSSSAVRHFGHTLMVDNLRAEIRIERVARNGNIELPARNDNHVHRDVAHLAQLPHSTLDVSFLKVTVRRLLHARDAFRIAEDATYGELSRLAGEDLPAIRKHLSAAVKLLPANERPAGM